MARMGRREGRGLVVIFFLFLVAALLVTSRLAWLWGYNKGRLDEYRNDRKAGWFLIK